MKKPIWAIGKYSILMLVTVIIATLLMSCAGEDGDDGLPGAPGEDGTSSGTITGTVTNDATDGPVAGASVVLDPSVQGISISTDSGGNYSASLPVGSYKVTFSKSGFANQSKTVSILAGVTSNVSAGLVPSANVVVNAGVDKVASPGESVDIGGSYDIMDNSSVVSIQWSLAGTVSGVTILNGTTLNPTVLLPPLGNFKEEVIEAQGTTRNRTEVQALTPLALEEAGAVLLELDVTTSSGSYDDEMDIQVTLPWQPNSGIGTQPKNAAVILRGKDMGDSNWTWTLLNPGGIDNTSSLDDPTSQYPSFTPTVVGKYTATVTNGTISNTLDVYSGTYVGVIDNGLTLDALALKDNDPVGDNFCTTCHTTEFSDWRKSGHAEILTQNINNPSGHWTMGCAPCHTAGYDTGSANDGFDESATAEGWTAPAHGDPDNWADMLKGYPDTARRANIQCENCHGPQASSTVPGMSAHGNDSPAGMPRVSLSSDVCGTCHGEPKRHARFQQWELSSHAIYNLAEEEAVETDQTDPEFGFARSCSLCHSANGFVTWGEGYGFADGNDDAVLAAVNATIPVGLSFADIVHPQTCAACHPVHNPGDTSGDPSVNNAKVRIEDATPVLKAGFSATGVGKGAVCMICHNSRRGLYNDNNLPSDSGTRMNDREPHYATQADVLMGQNMFFVQVGARGAHSFVSNTCASCHLELTPPPAELSYNLGGTNHTFAASLNICQDCHGTFDGGTLQVTVTGLLADLKTAIETAITQEVLDLTAAANTLHVENNDLPLVEFADIDATYTVDSVDFYVHHSRAAMSIGVTNSSGSVTVNDVHLDEDTLITAGPNTGTLVRNDMAGTNGQDIAKSAWNYGMIEHDGSHGIHNPGFVIDVISASTDALNY